MLFQHLTDLVFRKCLDDHLKVMQQDRKVSSEDLELRATEKGFCTMLLDIYMQAAAKETL